MPYYNRDPKRENNFDNHQYDGTRLAFSVIRKVGGDMGRAYERPAGDLNDYYCC